MPRTPRRPSPALVIASLALFIALGGTGYAAVGNIAAHKTHKKSPRPLTTAQVNQLIARYFTSHAASLHGANGTNGAPDPQGPPGGAGPAGPTTTMAPSGSTQTGVFGIGGYASNAGNDFKASISFPLQLASAPTVDQLPFPSTDSHCTGNSGAPTATPGYLCIYIRSASNSSPIGSTPLYAQEPGQLNFGAGTAGSILTARATAAGLMAVEGSWAVTAP